MSSQMVPLQPAPLPLNSVPNILSERDSSYIVNKVDLRRFLERKFNRTDFEISVRNGVSMWRLNKAN